MARQKKQKCGLQRLLISSFSVIRAVRRDIWDRQGNDTQMYYVPYFPEWRKALNKVDRDMVCYQHIVYMYNKYSRGQQRVSQ